jgi:hypothetical protein
LIITFPHEVSREEVGMCYISAEGRSRDAREDEVLVVQRLPHGSNWLVSPDDPSTAVCLKEGTQVELLYVPEKTQRQFGFPPETQATFKMEKWWRRDLFVLPDGRKVELRKLQPGQVVRVLSKPVTLNQKELSPEKEPSRLESLQLSPKNDPQLG